jgi:prephenate dehydrogenase
MHKPQTLGIVGHGSFGKFLERLAKRFLPELTVRVFDRNASEDGKRFFPLEEVCLSDVVVIAVSIRAFTEVLYKVLPLLRPDSVLVDVNSVKKFPSALLYLTASDRYYISTHPMFGPFSFRKKRGRLKGLRIVISDHTLPKHAMEQAVVWLEGLGLKVVTMSSDDHDRQLAETLFLTHYVSQMVSTAGFVRTDIDTLSFGFLMDAVESVKGDTELFRDVYAFNKYCHKIVERLEKSQSEVHSILEFGRQERLEKAISYTSHRFMRRHRNIETDYSEWSRLVTDLLKPAD